jgi:hypothetical protein
LELTSKADNHWMARINARFKVLSESPFSGITKISDFEAEFFGASHEKLAIIRDLCFVLKVTL